MQGKTGTAVLKASRSSENTILLEAGMNWPEAVHPRARLSNQGESGGGLRRDRVRGERPMPAHVGSRKTSFLQKGQASGSAE